MIAITFTKEHGPAEKRAALGEYLGQWVTVQTNRDHVGILQRCDPRAVQVSGLSTLLAYSDITAVWVHIGGDWSTSSGHKAHAMTDRIHVRCASKEKKDLAAEAARLGVSLSEYVREAALHRFGGGK